MPKLDCCQESNPWPEKLGAALLLAADEESPSTQLEEPDKSVQKAMNAHRRFRPSRRLSIGTILIFVG
jgi:hypothetical protein